LEDLERVDIVYHLAAIMFIPYAIKNPGKVYQVNVGGTINILEYCRLNDISKLIFASSYVYGEPDYLPVDETHPIKPTNPYTRSKVVSEELCRGYSEDHGIKCVILRPFNIYGPGQNEEFLIPLILKQIREGTIIELKDPEPKRDLLYVNDMIEAYIKAGEYFKNQFEIFNIGSGKSYSVQNIVDMIVQLVDKKVEIKYTGERRENEVMDTIASIEKAITKLNWQPTIELKDGLELVIDQ
jgi:UDP-glucose 4-epimerase